MDLMMKPKEALVKDGFLPAGADRKRGRLSLDAIERLKDLASAGWEIEGYEVTDTPDATGAAVVDKVKTDPNAIADLPPMTRDENTTAAFTINGEVGMRTVCQNCRASLTYCPCPHPQVWLDHTQTGVVVFKQRTSPLKRKW